MIALIKTETVFFKNKAELDGYIDAQAAAGNIEQGMAIGIKMNGMATRATSVAQRPASESYTALADMPQLKFAGE